MNEIEEARYQLSDCLPKMQSAVSSEVMENAPLYSCSSCLRIELPRRTPHHNLGYTSARLTLTASSVQPEVSQLSSRNKYIVNTKQSSPSPLDEYLKSFVFYSNVLQKVPVVAHDD